MSFASCHAALDYMCGLLNLCHCVIQNTDNLWGLICSICCMVFSCQFYRLSGLSLSAVGVNLLVPLVESSYSNCWMVKEILPHSIISLQISWELTPGVPFLYGNDKLITIQPTVVHLFCLVSLSFLSLSTFLLTNN